MSSTFRVRTIHSCKRAPAAASSISRAIGLPHLINRGSGGFVSKREGGDQDGQHAVQEPAAKRHIGGGVAVPADGGHACQRLGGREQLLWPDDDGADERHHAIAPGSE
jgi:hypothetical protein